MATGASGCDVYAIFLNWTSNPDSKERGGEFSSPWLFTARCHQSCGYLLVRHTKVLGLQAASHPIQDEGFEAVTLRKIADVTASFCFLCGWP